MYITRHEKIKKKYLADWLAWLGMLTTVGSGEGVLRGGGGGLSQFSSSSTGSCLMVTCAGPAGTLCAKEVDGCGPGTAAEGEDIGNGVVDSAIGRFWESNG